MIIVGIDQSKNSTGVVELKDGILNRHCCIKQPKKKLKETESLIYIKNNLIDFIDKNTDLVIMEGLSFGARGKAIFILGGLSFMLRAYFIENRYDLLIIQPTMLKKFVTGLGNAGKDFILLNVYKKWKIDFSQYKESAKDIADAFGLAKIGWYWKNFDNIDMTKIEKQIIKNINISPIEIYKF